MQELEDNDEKFKQYFRLSPAQFKEALTLIEEDITMQDPTTGNLSL